MGYFTGQLAAKPDVLQERYDRADALTAQADRMMEQQRKGWFRRPLFESDHLPGDLQRGRGTNYDPISSSERALRYQADHLRDPLYADDRISPKEGANYARWGRFDAPMYHGLQSEPILSDPLFIAAVAFTISTGGLGGLALRVLLARALIGAVGGLVIGGGLDAVDQLTQLAHGKGPSSPGQFAWQVGEAAATGALVGAFVGVFPGFGPLVAASGLVGAAEAFEQGMPITGAFRATAAIFAPKVFEKLFKLVFGDNCFPAGTLVDTEYGLRAIEAIRPRDRVWAYDFVTGRWRLCEVLGCFDRFWVGDIVALRLRGETIRSTSNHPFWVTAGDDLDRRPPPAHVDSAEGSAGIPGRWVDAADLRAGDVVLLRSGESAVVEAIESSPQRLPVYNIQVAELHTYAVGDSRVLVHNRTVKNPDALIENTTATKGQRSHALDLLSQGKDEAAFEYLTKKCRVPEEDAAKAIAASKVPKPPNAPPKPRTPAQQAALEANKAKGTAYHPKANKYVQEVLGETLINSQRRRDGSDANPIMEGFDSLSYTGQGKDAKLTINEYKNKGKPVTLRQCRLHPPFPLITSLPTGGIDNDFLFVPVGIKPQPRLPDKVKLPIWELVAVWRVREDIIYTAGRD
jgi:hypothetical protein